MLAWRTLFLLAAPLLAACAAVTAADGHRLAVGSSEFRSYVEGVFREQNKTASDLAFAIEDAAGPNGTQPLELDAAEETLLAACAGLNELATSRRDDRSLGLRRSVELARKAPECERATLAARAVLSRVSR
jgi:hypothetical protein